MLSFIFRAITVVWAAFYAVFSVGVAQFIPKKSETAVYENVQDIPVKPAVTVHILQCRPEIGLALQQAVDEYKKDTTIGTTFSVQTVNNLADYGAVLRRKLFSGENVELFQIAGARELAEFSAYTMPLNTMLPWLQQAAAPGSIDAVSIDGEIYGVPYSLEASGLLVNRNILEAAEISPDDLTNFEDLTEVFRDLNGRIAAGEFREDFPQLESATEFAAKDKAFLGGQFADIAFSGAFASPMQASLAKGAVFPNVQPVEDIVKFMARFSASRNDWRGLGEISQNMATSRFATQRVAAILQDTNVYSRVNEQNPDLHMLLLPIPLPTYEQAVIYTGVPTYWALNATVDAASQQASADFLNWLYRTPKGTGFFAEKFLAVSPFQDTAANTNIAIHNQMLHYMQNGQTLPQIHNELPQGWLDAVFAPNVQRYFAEHDLTWAEVVAHIAGDFEKEE